MSAISCSDAMKANKWAASMQENTAWNPEKTRADSTVWINLKPMVFTGKGTDIDTYHMILWDFWWRNKLPRTAQILEGGTNCRWGTEEYFVLMKITVSGWYGKKARPVKLNRYCWVVHMASCSPNRSFSSWLLALLPLPLSAVPTENSFKQFYPISELDAF